MRILTSGTLSGLGRHIYEAFGGLGWTRQLPAKDRKEIKRKGVDLIIHCAFNSRQSVDSNDLYAYLSDNVLLTHELAVSVPREKFIFISSVDVYPSHARIHSEDEVIDINSVDGIYGVTKLMSEAIVRHHCPDHLILRCVSLLGKYSRKNSLIRIVEDEPCTLTLSGDSRFNYILHSDVSDFIAYAIRQGLEGIYNVASVGNVTLSTIANMLDKQVAFGDYLYDVGDIDNSKISSVFPAFRKTSKEVVAQFARDRTARQ